LGVTFKRGVIWSVVGRPQLHAAQNFKRQQSVTARFLTGYAALEEFAANFEQVLNENRDSAVLSGKLLPLRENYL